MKRDAEADGTASSTTADRTRSVASARLRNRGFPQRRVQLAQPLVETHLGLPPEYLLRPSDVGLAHLRIVDGQRLEDDLAAAAPHLEHLLCELEQRELVWIADVHRQMLAALDERDQAADQVVDVAEAARLGAVTEDGERLALHRLADEGRDRPPVVGTHPGPVGVEDPDDRRVDALLPVIRHRQSLRVPL